MIRRMTILALFLGISLSASAADVECEGRWVNPITDVCWDCIFPISIGSAKVSVGKYPDPPNPASPIQVCPMGIFWRIGIAIGFWEPFAMTDVSRSPMCMVNMGGFSLNAGKIGTGTGGQSELEASRGFYHVHWYKYPLINWLNIITDVACMQGGDMDIGYLSELDPLWNDSNLSLMIQPEALLFGNLIAQSACAVDAVAASTYLPLSTLFWCAGAHGSMYPFTGSVSNEFNPIMSSILLSERMAFKLHRQGMIVNSVGADTAVCFEYPSPIIPKERYRYQMVNMFPDSTACHPLGASVLRWEAGRNPPNSRKNYGYLLWRKRNCVIL
nr:conjugal transfer pilus assembly protein TraU [Pseudomonas sp. P5_152]